MADDEAPTVELPVVKRRWWAPTAEHPNPVDWSGTVAVILALGVMLALVILAVAAGIQEANPRTELSQTIGNVLATTMGAAIGAVATFLGISVRGRERGAEAAADDAGLTDRA